ncbi:MAG: tRNA pseudouridine(38-40) synthase TruA [Bacteroidales bacterium]|nr:tRNA pseudouridine(38-40) synthase TruA [Bacteroidales bacterium]
MQRYFIYLSYNGRNYCGWQIQPNGISVQSTLENALSLILRSEISVTGAGRTDAGVHASCMVAHFDVPCGIENVDALAEKLNRILPKDIAVIKLIPVNGKAHARFDALSRTYHYFITDRKDPFYGDLFYKVHNKLDIGLMNKAAAILFEYTDFTSFSKLHTDVKTNICHIMEARFIPVDSGWRFTIKADRFLRNMVRAIMGTLLDVGRGKIGLDDFRTVIEMKDRGKAGSSVPAQGLFLVDVGYPEWVFRVDKADENKEESVI